MSRAHVEQGIALYDPQRHRSLAFLYGGEDPGVMCLSFAAWVLWHLGYPDQALERMHQALTLAQELSHPFSLAIALNHAASLHQYRGEGQAAQGRADAAIRLSTDQGFTQWLAWGTILRGCTLAGQGQGMEGMAQMHQGLAAYRAAGAELGRPYQLALLAEAYGEIGKAEEGLSTLAEALAAVDNSEERFYEAELYRLRGELLLMQAGGAVGAVREPPLQTQAEACFQRALEVARRQQARSLELRAAMSLSRLWRQQGKREAAQQLLAPIYGWFTEGFDTADLQEAKALLEGMRTER